MRKAVAWIVSNLRYSPFEWSASLPHICYYGTSTYGKMRRDTDTMWVPIGIGPIHLSHDFHMLPSRMAKRDEMHTQRGFPLE
jgi:hypothetical protein